MDTREKTGVNYHEDTLRGLVQTQIRESREKPGPDRDHCPRDTLTPYACRTQNPAFESAIGGTSQLQPANSEVGIFIDLPQPRLSQVLGVKGKKGLWSETPEVGMMVTTVAAKL